MQLNTPPPGTSGAAEIVPAVAGPSARKTPTQVSDALGTMLRGSQGWNSVATAVTRRVTTVSWVLLVLDVVAIILATGVDGDSIFARILTWNFHTQTIVGVASSATGLMVLTAMNTAGLRRANLTWLRVWILAALVSLVAVVAIFVAVVVGLAIIAFGILVAIALIVFVGGMLAAALE